MFDKSKKIVVMSNVKGRDAKRIRERFWSKIEFRLKHRFGASQLKWVASMNAEFNFNYVLDKTIIENYQKHYLINKDTEEKIASREIKTTFSKALWRETVVFKYKGHKNPFAPLNPLEYAVAFVKIMF